MTDKADRHRHLPLIIAAAAVIVRILYLIEVSGMPGFEHPMVDEKWHWEWAASIINDSFFGAGDWFRAPLYPYFLALLHWVSGASVFWAKFLQIFLCGGTAFFIYRLAEHLFGRTAAIASGLVYAFYGTLIFYESMFLIPVLFVMLVVWGMYRLIAYGDSQAWTTWAATGLIFGLAAISRPNILLVVPFLLLWLFLKRHKTMDWKPRLRRPLLVLAGVVICIAPVTLRNAAVTGEFILISSQGGVNLYLGNNPEADGLTMLMPEVDLDESVTWRQFTKVTKAAAEEEAGRSLSAGQQSSFWTGKAISFIVEHPGDFLGLLWRKTVFLVSGFENSDNADIYSHRRHSNLYGVLLWEAGLFFPFGVLLPAALMGVWVLRRRWRDLLPIYIFLIAYVPSIVLFLVTARHRLPLVPFLIILAAAGVTNLVGRWKSTPLRDRVVPIAILIATLVLFNQTWFGQEEVRGEFQTHFNLGIQYEKEGKLELAEQEYLAADADFPASATLLNNLAHVQYQLGKIDEAERNYNRSLRLDPDFPPTLNNLGLLMRDRENIDSAIVLFRKAAQGFNPDIAADEDVGQAWLNLADAFDRHRMLDSTAAAYAQAMKAAPEWSRPYALAAAFYARHQGYRKADSLFIEAADRGDLKASDAFNWGLALIQGGRPHHGRGLMHRALSMDRNMFQAYYCIGLAHFEEKSPRDSVLYYLDKALEMNPDYEPAKKLYETVLSDDG